MPRPAPSTPSRIDRGSPLPPIVGTGVAALLALSLACAPATEAPVPPDNLVVITFDTLRRDHLGCYGYFRDTSPHIDALAEESLVFDACRAPVSQTLPTHTSLFTGLYPLEHGVEANLNQTQGRYVPSPKVRPVAELLASQGYHTAAFVSAEPVKRESGLAQGFEVWDEPEEMWRPANVTVDLALEWFAERPAGPYHLWLHLFDAHLPYEPPPPYDTHFQAEPAQAEYMAEREFLEILKPSRWRKVEMESRIQHDLYDGEILFADAHLGRLLDALRAAADWERTVVVFTSDHGEGLGQHYMMGHEALWGEQLQVPLMIRAPGLEPGRVALPLTSRDVLPTALGLLRGARVESFLELASGSDLLAAVAEGRGEAAAERPTFAQSPGSHTKRIHTITQGKWRLIVGMVKRDLLFDLERDPHELQNVAKGHPEKVAELKALLEAEVARQTARREELGAGRLAPASEERKSGLEGLGYGGGED